jgi:NAD(P)-dependent dehydrogenase (short-subunit alcohol dehydrogenase family)
MSTSPPTAIVTGASSGIGLAIARTLAEEGYSLTLAARRPEPLRQAVDQLRKDGAAVEGMITNVAEETDIQALVAHHRQQHRSLDVLVNNAGIGITGGIAEYRTSHMDLQYRVDLRSIAIFYREALALLIAGAQCNGRALVVNTSSITGKYGEPELAFYSAVKHGVVGFTQAMNAELHDRGIRSCVLCPGYVDTPLSDYVKGSIPAERMITAQDLGEAVRFLTRLSHFCVVPEILFQRPGDSP